MRHDAPSFVQSQWLAVLVVPLLVAVLGPSPLQAQSGSKEGPSIDQLKAVLPATLPAMERTQTRREGPSAVVGVYERTGERGPPRVDVKVTHGRVGLTQARNFAQRPETDSTTIRDGRTFYSGVVGQGDPSGIVLWNADPYVVGMEVKGTPDAALSAEEARTFLDPLRDELADAVTAEDLPDAGSASGSSMPTATGFEAPDGFTAITGQYGAMFGDKDSRISVAYPEGWTARDASEIALAEVLDISRREAASTARWGGGGESDGDATTLFEPDDVHIQVAGPGMIHQRPVGGIAPIDGLDAEEVKSRVQDATVVEPLAETTIGGNAAAAMTVEGTSADGYAVRHRMVCIESNGAVPCATITHPANVDAAVADTVRTILESIVAEPVPEE